MIKIFVMTLTPMILILCGILIKYFKQYWLIAGYNTASKKEKENVDIDKLGSFIGNNMFLLGGINLLGILLRYLGYKLLGDLTWGLFIMVTIFMIIKAQSFNKYSSPSDKKMNRYAVIVTLFIMLPVLVLSVGLIGYGNLSNEITIDMGLIRISGMYGTSVSRDAITSIELIDDIPDIETKINGFDFGNINKGVFQLKDWGNGRVYLESNKGPYIAIRYNTEGFIIINYKNAEETKQVYEMISNEL